MSETHARFEGSIPAFYDRCLGPFLFEPYAEDLARRLPARADAHVLEMACGTGIATRHLRRELPAGAQLVATDLNGAMIELARIKLAGADIHWRTADACALPFKDGMFDAAVCQFGLMFLPEPAKGFREARRVLRPGGTLLANVWCPLEDNPAAAIADEVVSRMFDDDPPRFLRVPYGSLDADAMRTLAIEGGFATAAVSRVALTGCAASARDVAEGFVKGTPLSIEIVARGGDLDVVAGALEQALSAHGGIPFRSPLTALVLAAS